MSAFGGAQRDRIEVKLHVVAKLLVELLGKERAFSVPMQDVERECLDRMLNEEVGHLNVFYVDLKSTQTFE